MPRIFSTGLTVSGLRVESSVPKNSIAWMKANSLFYPVGPGYSEAWLVLSGENNNLLTAPNLKNSSHTIRWTTATQPDNGNPTSVTKSFPGWYYLHSERVLQGGPNQDGALFLARFVDVRYLRLQNSDSGSIRANIRSYAQSTEYLDSTEGYTWTSLVTALWTAVGGLGTFPGLPAGLPLDGTPQTDFFIGLNGLAALNAVLDHLDCAICPIPSPADNNLFTIVQLGKAQTLPDNLPIPQQNFEPTRSNVHCAATLKFYFNKLYKNYGQEKDTELVDNWATGTNSVHSASSAPTNITGAIGTKPLWDDMYFIVDVDGTDANITDRNDRITSRTERYVTRYTCDNYHRIYSGIRTDVNPGGTIKAILFRNWDDGVAQDGITQLNPYGGTVTEWIAKPEYVHNQDEFLASNFLSSNTAKTLPVQENYLAPDLGRRTYPNYPRLPNMIQLYHDGAVAGETVSAEEEDDASAYGIHQARVVRLVDGVMTVLENCYILFMDDFDTNQGFVDGIQGEFYFGRLTGTKSLDATRLPVYLCKRSESVESIIHFELAENLYLGEDEPTHAKAVKLELVAGEWELPGTPEDWFIEVYDWYRPNNVKGMWNGFTGYRGLAVKRATDYELNQDNARYLITYPSGFWANEDTNVTFEVNSDPTGSVTWDGTPENTADLLTELGAELDALTGLTGNYRLVLRGSYAGGGLYIEIEFINALGAQAVDFDITLQSTSGTGEATITEINPGASSEATRPAYDIIWMERPAQWIEFYTNEYMGKLEFKKANIDIQVFDNQGVNPDGLPFGQDEYVVDTNNIHQDIGQGCYGYANYNNELNRYEIISGQRVAMFAIASANGSQCPGATITVDGFAVTQVGEHTGLTTGLPTETPTTVNNPYGIPVLDNDQIMLVRENNDLDTAEWMAIVVKQHEVTMTRTVTLATGDIYYTPFTFYANICSTSDGTPVLVIEGEECA